jgi:uncharacterized membrane protein YphA (DoxX/SURF4 family)
MSGVGKIASYEPTTACIHSVGLPLAALGWVIASSAKLVAGCAWFSACALG